MAVYVDDMEVGFGRMIMCHMIADSTEELLAMADRIGVQRKWIQKPGTSREHFDIAKSKRALAVRFGAREISMRELARRTRPAAYVTPADPAPGEDDCESGLRAGSGSSTPPASRSMAEPSGS